MKSRQYRPHFVLGDPEQETAVVAPGNVLTEQYLGVQIDDGPDEFAYGEEIVVLARLLYWEGTPNGFYDGLVPGATFTIREGARIVGHGVILAS